MEDFLSTMKKIPKPCYKKHIPVDNSQQFIKEWKELFNSIDPENIVAYIEGDDLYKQIIDDFYYTALRLDGACNTDVQLIIRIKKHNKHLGFSVGNIYCCLDDQAYDDSSIGKLDENLDTLNSEPIRWKEVYNILVKNTKIFFKRINNPIKK
jgi:hypothetical protein